MIDFEVYEVEKALLHATPHNVKSKGNKRDTEKGEGCRHEWQLSWCGAAEMRELRIREYDARANSQSIDEFGKNTELRG